METLVVGITLVAAVGMAVGVSAAGLQVLLSFISPSDSPEQG